MASKANEWGAIDELVTQGPPPQLNIGANRPKTPGTVPDLEHLSRVLPRNENLPGLSRNSMSP